MVVCQASHQPREDEINSNVEPKSRKKKARSAGMMETMNERRRLAVSRMGTSAFLNFEHQEYLRTSDRRQ